MVTFDQGLSDDGQCLKLPKSVKAGWRCSLAGRKIDFFIYINVVDTG